MNQFEEFKNIYDIIIVPISSLITAYIIFYLHEKLKIESKKITTLFAVVTVSIFVIISDYFVERITVKSPTFRHWIDPDNFIEGYWYDVTLDSIKGDSSKVITHALLMKIDYNKEGYYITGDAFDTSGIYYSSFRSDAAVYLNRRLFFTFVSQDQEQFIITGMDQLQFAIPPTSYAGFYYSFSKDSKKIPVSGFKVSDKDLKGFNNFSDHQDKTNFIIKVVKNAKEELRISNAKWHRF